MNIRTILSPLVLSFAIIGCGYKTITYGSGSGKYYYSAEILKENNVIIANEQAGAISVKFVDTDTISRLSLKPGELKLRLVGEFNRYELSFSFDMISSTYLTPGEYQMKLISEDTTAHIETELPKILVKAGDYKNIELGVGKNLKFVDVYTEKKIPRSEWRKMKRENRK
jgi:hypothetical protein